MYVGVDTESRRMKIKDFKELIKKSVELIAEKPEELTDEEFVRFVSNVDIINKLLKTDKVKKAIEEV